MQNSEESDLNEDANKRWLEVHSIALHCFVFLLVGSIAGHKSDRLTMTEISTEATIRDARNGMIQKRPLSHLI